MESTKQRNNQSVFITTIESRIIILLPVESIITDVRIKISSMTLYVWPLITAEEFSEVLDSNVSKESHQILSICAS